MGFTYAMCQNVAMKIAAFLLLSAPLAFAGVSGLKAVFGPDDRFAMESHAYPYSAIVRIENSEGGHCTGSLISRDVVLTNSHCLVNESGARYQGIKAKVHGLPGFAPTVSVRETLLGTTNYDDEPGNDWALVQLSEPLGDVVGSFKLAASATIGNGYTLAGYSGDYRGGHAAGVHAGCSLLGSLRNYGIVMHDCDMTKGASGSGIWKQEDSSAVIYALNSAQNGKRDERDTWTSHNSNLAVPVETFASAAQSFITANVKDYESGLVVCNSTQKKRKFAFGYWSASHSLSKGWYSIAAGQCKAINLPNEIEESRDNTKVYAYAEDLELGAVYFRDFCIGGFFSFEKDEGSCRGPKEKVFSQIGEIKFGKINRIDIK